VAPNQQVNIYFRATKCDIDHYLMVAKVRERLAVSKQKKHRVHMERFNLKKLRGRAVSC
jgi:hypothetical protein